MFIQMLKNQRVTFVSDVEQAEKNSPFRYEQNPTNFKYVVYDDSRDSAAIVAAGLDLQEAMACVMFKANEFIFREIQKGK